MEFPEIEYLIIDYLLKRFDHSLIQDQSNDPFVQISQIYTSTINPHRSSFGLFLKDKDRSAIHTGYTTHIMACALSLEAKYLVTKPPKGQPIEDAAGYVRGLPIDKNKVLIITIIADPEDATFVCLSIIREIQIILNLTD